MKGEGKRPPASVELKLLAHNPFNPREELTNVEETADSLRAKGQIQLSQTKRSPLRCTCSLAISYPTAATTAKTMPKTAAHGSP